MQTAFGSAFGEFSAPEIEQAEKALLDALRIAVAEITIKELAHRLDVRSSLLSDALAERSCKGVRAAWLITIIDMASEAIAIAVVNALLATRRTLEVAKRKVLTPEERAQRLEEKLRTLGPVGLQLIREAMGE